MIVISESERGFLKGVGIIEVLLLVISQCIEWHDCSLGAGIVAFFYMPILSGLVVVSAICVGIFRHQRGDELRLKVALGGAIGVPLAAVVLNCLSLFAIRPFFSKTGPNSLLLRRPRKCDL